MLRARVSGCQTSSSRHSRASHPPTPLGVPRVCSLTSSRCGTTIGYMLFGTGFPRTLRRTSALSILAVGLATTMLGGLGGWLDRLKAQGAASRKETEAWRAKHEVGLSPRLRAARRALRSQARREHRRQRGVEQHRPAEIGPGGHRPVRSRWPERQVRAAAGRGRHLEGPARHERRHASIGCRRGGRRTGRRGHHAVGAHQRRAADRPHARPERRNRAVVPWIPVVSD